MKIKPVLKRFNKSGNGVNYVVILDGVEIGSIFKFRNTKTETHPWKAYAGIGVDYRYLGPFYSGKQHAVSAVVMDALVNDRDFSAQKERYL